MKHVSTSLSLSQLQKWMRWVITDPRGVESALLDPNPTGLPERYQSPQASGYSLVSKSLDHSVENRLSVYAEGYFFRLLESLETDFKRLRLLMGELEFQLLISEYLKVYPSTNFNIGEVGLQLPQFFKLNNDNECWCEAAEFDLKILQVFYTVDGPTLDPKSFETLSEEDWENLRLEIDLSVKLLTSCWPLEKFWGLDFPSAPFQKAENQKNYLLWRKHYRVEFKEMTALEAAALNQLMAGKSLSQTIENLDETFSQLSMPEHLSQQVMEFFGRWISDGIISSLIT